MGQSHTSLWGTALYGALYGAAPHIAMGQGTLWGSPTRRYGAQRSMGQPHTSLWGRALHGAVPHVAMGHSMGQPHMSLWSTARYGAAPHIAMGQSTLWGSATHRYGAAPHLSSSLPSIGRPYKEKAEL